MEYIVDDDLCTGQGRCYSMAPGVFSEDDGGLNAIRGVPVAVEPGLVDAARLGADNCPERAITLRS